MPPSAASAGFPPPLAVAINCLVCSQVVGPAAAYRRPAQPHPPRCSPPPCGVIADQRIQLAPALADTHTYERLPMPVIITTTEYISTREAARQPEEVENLHHRTARLRCSAGTAIVIALRPPSTILVHPG